MSAPSSRFRSVLLMAALIVTIVVPVGCGDRPVSAPVIRPSGYHPEQFPDIPLPPGFVLRSDHDQLAVVLAGGSIRRFSVAMIESERQNAPEMSTDDVLSDYARRLPGLGWKPLPAAGRGQQRWSKVQPGSAHGGEILTVIAGRSGLRTTATLLLMPDAAP